VSEQRLDLGRVGPALAEPGGKSVTGAVRAQAGDAGVVAGGEHDLACDEDWRRILNRTGGVSLDLRSKVGRSEYDPRRCVS
jgi:hypothetical protein